VSALVRFACCWTRCTAGARGDNEYGNSRLEPYTGPVRDLQSTISVTRLFAAATTADRLLPDRKRVHASDQLVDQGTNMSRGRGLTTTTLFPASGARCKRRARSPDADGAQNKSYTPFAPHREAPDRALHGQHQQRHDGNAEHAPAVAVSPATGLSTIERETIEEVLRQCRWNGTRAAKRLGLTRTPLYLRVQKYGIEKPPEA
jgi:DNA-binding NtrC family response regulator